MTKVEIKKRFDSKIFTFYFTLPYIVKPSSARIWNIFSNPWCYIFDYRKYENLYCPSKELTIKISSGKKVPKVKKKKLQCCIYLFKINNKSTRTLCKICSKLTLKIQNDVIDVVLVSSLLSLNRFHTLFKCFHCLLWPSQYCIAAAKFYRGWLLHPVWYPNFRYPASHLKLSAVDLNSPSRILIRPRAWVFLCRLVLKSTAEVLEITYWPRICRLVL